VISIAIAGGVAIAVVLVTRGSLRQLAQLPIQSIWMVVVALAIQIALAFVDIPKDRIDDLGFGLLLASYAFLLAFCFVNLRVSMMWLIGLGIALNALVIGLNQGMPTRDREVTTRSGRTVEEPVERTVKHRPESDNDLLPFLGDQIVVPDPIGEIISIGDVVIAFGVIGVCYQGSRRRSRRRTRVARARARAARAAAPPPRRPQPASADQMPRPRLTPPSARPGRALTPDRDDDTLGVELDQVYARLAGEDKRREARRHGDEDEPEDS
jgi:Family of unknown function (DUF5317)